jgi:hypothetical protein
MLGRYNGATTFLASYMPYAIPIHCIAHKEALAAKDVSELLADSVDALMKLNLSAGVEIKIALNGTKN